MNLYLGFNKVFCKDPICPFFGYTPLIVMSGSMEPAIMTGDLVIIKHQTASEYEFGDIATYLEDDIAYTHRIISLENDSAILKGDSNDLADNAILKEDLVGKMILRIPKVGLFILFLKTPLGILGLIVIAVLILYLDEIRHAITKKKRRDSKIK